MTVNPNAFLFSQIKQRAEIRNNSVADSGTSPAGFDVRGLRVPDGKSLLLLGGDVSMDGGRLNAFGGRVELGGLTQPGTVALNVNGDNFSLGFPEDVTRGDVSLINSSGVFVTGIGEGDIALNARNVDITGGSVLSAGISSGLGTPETVAGDINLNATGDITVAGDGSQIRNLVRSDSQGNGGNITINSGSFNLGEGAQLSASTSGEGNAGNVKLTAENDVSLTDANIFSTVGAGGVGEGGNIDINAANLTLRSGAQLLTITREASDEQNAGQGDAGDINLNVTGLVDIAGATQEGENTFASGLRSLVETGTQGDGGNITINSGSFNLGEGAQLTASTRGEGNAGNMKLSAENDVSLTGGNIFSNVEAGGVGEGGNIDINAANLTLRSGAQIQTLTREAQDGQNAGQGNAGDINLNVTGLVDIAGAKDGFSSAILSRVETGTQGDGGNININSGSFNLGEGAQLSASTSGEGNAGNVKLTAENDVSLTDANIFSTVGAGGVGEGGDIDINAANLTLRSGAQLQTITREASDTQPAGQGNAGDINLNVTGLVDIAGAKEEGENTFASGLRSLVETGTQGDGGDITIKSGSFKLGEGADLSASTFGEGDAGNVKLTAENDVSLTDARIFSTVEPGGVGEGGNIDINAANLTLRSGAQLLTITREASDEQSAGQGDAGDINLNVTGLVDIAGEKNDFVSAIFSQVREGTEGDGGNITINSGSFNLGEGAQLSASTSGEGNAGNVKLTAENDVSLTDTAFIFSTVEAGGVGEGGNIDINAANLTLRSGAQLLTITREASDTQPAGQGNAGDINLNVTGLVDIAGAKEEGENTFASGLRSLVETGTQGDGGDITIKSGSFKLGEGADLSASTFGEGDAGNVKLTAENDVSLTDARIFSTVEPGGVGEGGDIDINAANLTLRSGAQLQTITREASDEQSAGKGDAGDIILNVTGLVDIAGATEEGGNTFASTLSSLVETGTQGDGGNITINSGSFNLGEGADLTASTFGEGDAGNVKLTAENDVSLTGGDIFSTVEAGGVGEGGDIDINAANLTLRSGARLSASTSGEGNAGNVKLNAENDVSLTDSAFIFSTVEAGGVGEGGDVNINAANLTLQDAGVILTLTRQESNTQPGGKGNAGDVNVKVTGAVDITGIEDGFSSGIRSSVLQGTEGEGGNITIDADSFKLRDGAILNARTENTQKGGDITVNANLFEVLNGGQVITTASDNGLAGKITVNATDKIIINGSTNFSDRITEFPERVFNVFDQESDASSGFFVNSTGSGNTGNIEINSPEITLDNQGKLSAESTSVNGGNINLTSDLLILRRGSQITTDARTAQQSGDGGNINIDSNFIVAIPEENSDITANASKGRGGNVSINSPGGVFGIEPREQPTNESDITATGTIQGEININAPDNSTIENALLELPRNQIDTEALIARTCVVRSERNDNTFYIIGPQGFPYRPGDPIPSKYPAVDVQPVPDEGSSSIPRRRWKIGDPIVEPNGVYTLVDGRRILSRECGT